MRGLHQFAALSAIGIHATDTHTDPETASNAISQNTCPDQQFSCDNGQTCLDLQAVCDGISDCKDKSDESKCSSSSNPKPKPNQELNQNQPKTENSNNSPEDLKKSRLRRQFPDYNYDLYDGFDGFPSTDFPLLDYGTTDTLDLFGDFNFETTPNPLFGFGGIATTAMPLFGGGFTTAIPSFGFGTTAMPSFNLATTEAAFPIFATPTPGFAVETTPMVDFGLATTAPSFPGLPTTAGFAFEFGPQTTTAGFEFGAPTTSLVTTAIPFGAPTTTMADFGPVETTPLSLLQTTEAEIFATTAPPTTEPLFRQTTQPMDILDINTTLEPTTEGFAPPTTQPIQPPTTAGLLQLQTTSPAGMLCSDGSTVPLDKICDGFNDCPGGDDEGEASNCPVILPLTTAPDLDFGLPTTAGPDFGLPTTVDPFGDFDPFENFLQTTAPSFLLPPQTTAPPFIFQTTQAPSQFTTDGFGFGGLVMMTTEPDRPQTTQYYQQQTTDSISFNEVDFNNIPNPPAPTRSTTSQTPMMTKPPSVEAMGEYGEENFARFMASFEIWRENVFDKWLSTAKTYKQRAMRDQGPPKPCPKQGRDSCANGRRTCTDDLNGCLYCYCRIDRKKDTHEAVVREYEEDIKFWKDVLEPQWKEMWEQWEDQWEEYERDEL